MDNVKTICTLIVKFMNKTKLTPKMIVLFSEIITGKLNGGPIPNQSKLITVPGKLLVIINQFQQLFVRFKIALNVLQITFVTDVLKDSIWKVISVFQTQLVISKIVKIVKLMTFVKTVKRVLN